MSFQVTARKWRPIIFDDIIGQQHIANTLRNALATNRLAHAFIFSGGRGCGKTTTARILAKAVNCLSPVNSNPCNHCEICEEINSGRSMDIIEIDGASTNGVDDIRDMRDAVRYTPTRGGKKVYIIDEVHMLSKPAFNALLKTLEEPPSHILFIFATTEIQKVPPTIISRCQRFDFRRIGIQEIIGRLKYIAAAESITIDDDALFIIAKKGDGSMRDAQSIFDQAISFCGTTITAAALISVLNLVDIEFFFRTTDYVAAHDASAGLMLVEEIVQRGYDIREFVSGLAEHLRNLLIVKTSGNDSLLDVADVYRKRYMQEQHLFGDNDLLRLIRLTTELDSSLRYHTQPRFALEAAFVQMAKMTPSVQIDDLLNRLQQLGGKAPAAPSTSRLSASKPIEQKTQTSASSPLIPSSPEPISIPPAVKPAQTSPAISQTTTMSLQSIQEIWPRIADEARRKRISVGTILGESVPTTLSDQTLTIACDDEFHLSTLNRNHQFLTELVNTMLGTNLRITPLLRPTPNIQQGKTETRGKQPPTTENGSNPALPPQKNENTESHPVIARLLRDFGAEPIQ